MASAAIYCRVSTKEQTQNLSLSTQQKACEEYCQRNGIEVARVFVEEGESAKTADRTELQRLIHYCGQNKRLIDFVVVYNLSRFSRETRDHHALAATLAGFGTRLRSVSEPIDESPVGRFMESIFASIAQFDNDMKAERSKKTMLAVLEQGRWTFQAPLGYQTGGRVGASLLVDEGPATIICDAFEALAARRIEKSQAREWMNRRGLRTRNGKELSVQTARNLLRNPIYAGRVVVPKWKVAVAGDFEPIVRSEIFDRVQTLLAGNKVGARSWKLLHPDFTLRRFVRCGHCQKPLTGSWTRGRSARYGYYHCTSCGRVRVPKAELEVAFEGLLERLRPAPGFLKLFHAIVLDAWKGRQGEARALRAKLERRVAGLRERLDKLDDAFLFRHQIDQASYERQRDRMRQQLALGEFELTEATVEQLDLEGLLGFAEHVLGNARALWVQATAEQRVRLQAVLFPEGVPFDGSRFGTAVTCLAFAQLADSAEQKDGVASPTGFEPVSPP